jgi:hypothetical protein
MRTIRGVVTEEIAAAVDATAIASEPAYRVASYRKLVEQVAKLAYLNLDYLLFYRGQHRDYRNKVGASTFYPTIYRGAYLRREEVHSRFERLAQTSTALRQAFREEKLDGYDDLCRIETIQWSILQHYGVCDTPLLDFTHSLRVACSFALLENDSESTSPHRSGYVYVFGLPYVTGRISTNYEHYLVNVRLLSIAPPGALRPYFQEGYLAGTTDITTEYRTKTRLDFKNRLIAKFEIPNHKSFWGKDFSAIPRSALYPPDDRVDKLCGAIRAATTISGEPV